MLSPKARWTIGSLLPKSRIWLTLNLSSLLLFAHKHLSIDGRWHHISAWESFPVCCDRYLVTCLARILMEEAQSYTITQNLMYSTAQTQMAGCLSTSRVFSLKRISWLLISLVFIHRYTLSTEEVNMNIFEGGRGLRSLNAVLKRAVCIF